MQQDDMIWSCLKNSFCSFKVMTKTQMMCKNDNNVLGICSKSACPLANSNYATIREHRGVIYVCKKVVERAAFPHKLWEKVKLPENYEQALAMIDEVLPYWDERQVHRCKQRYTKIYQYIERARKQATKMRTKKLITLPRKMERREKAREKKALIAAKLENEIESEIMNRVKQGVYGDRYKFKDSAVFEKALAGPEREAELEILAGEPQAGTSGQAGGGKTKSKKGAAAKRPLKLASKYVADIEDLGDLDRAELESGSGDEFWASEDEQWEREQPKRAKKARPMLTVEWEK